MSDEQKKVTLMQVISSVLAAMFGVQSAKNRERDFSKGEPWHYAVVGLIFTIIFILIVYGVVQLVISKAAH
ncbi:DUF2970 domain-containing protein [Candidatus Berkiella aquae]|uniref:DUF2970 domain-containing protein n=1 Tax=Candidatus Berkiella aquae TaxID=295108 RepID=A0A0Q9YX26_9GAMM|nr:DUF2970 domain-containing protein [Candidatus Berkiella aquae]MCS5712525.1 DUF2970 domain-containing protein [Candidatus Berkiella aquae]